MDFELDGNSLSLDAFGKIVDGGQPVVLSAAARTRMEASRATVERLAASGAPVYGVTTGFGLLADRHIGPEDLRELQVNLLRSHACGVGAPLTERESRAMVLLRANVLAKGYSGTRPDVCELLIAMLNHKIHPVIPSRGSVGASGDLAPLAHLALVLIGEGEVHDRLHLGSGRIPGAKALAAAGLKPIELAAKEGLALLNGTQAMLAVGLLSIMEAQILCDSADVIGSLTLDALRGTPTAFDLRLHEWARPHPGQAETAANLRRLNAGSAIRESHRTGDPRVQDAYSLRCMPQVHGAFRGVLAHVRGVFEIEMNSATDNPLVFGDDILSGGNFHGQPIAFALDYLAIGLAALAGISERRTERLVNPMLSEGLPAFLAARPGLDSGFMPAQITAAALVSENKVLAHPASVDSITTSGNKEDYVSMGMAAALKLRQVIENTRNVLAIESLCAAQALDGNPHKTSPVGERARKVIRAGVKRLEADRVLSGDIAIAAEIVAEGKLARLLHE